MMHHIEPWMKTLGSSKLAQSDKCKALQSNLAEAKEK
jgi:hypothetical protein